MGDEETAAVRVVVCLHPLPLSVCVTLFIPHHHGLVLQQPAQIYRVLPEDWQEGTIQAGEVCDRKEGRKESQSSYYARIMGLCVTHVSSTTRDCSLLHGFQSLVVDDTHDLSCVGVHLHV